MRLGVLDGVFEDTGVAVGRRVRVGSGVGVGAGVRVMVLVDVGVAVPAGVRVGSGVEVGGREGLGFRVRVMVGVLEAVAVGRGEGVAVMGEVAVMVGGSPSRMNLPEAFQLVPTKICTSYSPASHCGAGRCQLATATPGGKSFHDTVSTYLSAPFWYQSAVHSTLTPRGWYVNTEYICLIGLLNLSPGATSV